jgi:hypothetical protein
MESHEIELDGKMYPSMLIEINRNFHDSVIDSDKGYKYRTVKELLDDAYIQQQHRTKLYR